MAVKNEGLPDLFVRLAKEAGANLPLRRTTVIDVDIIEEYLKENPDVEDTVRNM